MASLLSQIAPNQGKIQDLVTPQKNKFTSEETNLNQPASTCSIAHAIPGRIRLRVPRIAQDAAYLEHLEALLKADTWVKSQRSNSAAASIVVTYEPKAIADNEMRSHLIQLIESASGVRIARLSTGCYERSQPGKQLPPLACSLEIRKVKVAAESCGLLKSRSGEPLKGGSLKARINKLHRLGILI